MITYKTLGEIVKITKGKKVDFSDKGEKGYIDIGILRTNQIVQYTDNNGVECKKEDILIAWDGSKSGTIGYGLTGIIGSTLAKLEITEKDVYTPYVGEFLKSKFDYLNTYTSGAAIPHIRKEVLIGIEIPLPPLETQKTIVAKLDQIFAELDQTKSEIQKNLDNTDELWKSALNQAFQGDWEMKKLGEMAEIGDGLHGTPQYEQLSEYRFINGNNIKGGHINFNSAKYVSESTYNKLKIDFTVGRTVFMSINGTIGNLAFYNNEKIALGKSVCYFNIKYPDLSTEYLYYYLQTNKSKTYYDDNKTGNTIMNLGLKAIREYFIPVPPLSEQEKIVEHLDQVSKEVKALKSQYQSQLDNLEELKKSVLDKAFRGELGE